MLNQPPKWFWRSSCLSYVIYGTCHSLHRFLTESYEPLTAGHVFCSTHTGEERAVDGHVCCSANTSEVRLIGHCGWLQVKPLWSFDRSRWSTVVKEPATASPVRTTVALINHQWSASLFQLLAVTTGSVSPLSLSLPPFSFSASLCPALGKKY